MPHNCTMFCKWCLSSIGIHEELDPELVFESSQICFQLCVHPANRWTCGRKSLHTFASIWWTWLTNAFIERQPRLEPKSKNAFPVNNNVTVKWTGIFIYIYHIFTTRTSIMIRKQSYFLCKKDRRNCILTAPVVTFVITSLKQRERL